MGNTFGNLFKVTSWGESHGYAVGVVIDGCPAGLSLTKEDIQNELNKRRPGRSKLSSQRREKDEPLILSGIFDGKTTGMPISVIVKNEDIVSENYDDIKDILRPGHADYTYWKKYGIRDYRGGGRSSGRETVARVIAGSIAKKILLMNGVEVVAHVVQIGKIKARPMSFQDIKSNIEKNSVRCADLDAAISMTDVINDAKDKGDSVGGIVEIICRGAPPGLGEPVFDKLDADLAKSLMSIGAVKGVEIGLGFNYKDKLGSMVNDEFFLENGDIKTRSNNSGGILGGISTGDDIVCRIVVKPTPSISKPQKTVDISKMRETNIAIKGRHDPCICPRICPVAESMVSIVIVDHMLLANKIEKGGI
ncbi:MAG: chorismate synthase [Candidatus Methanoliparum thermophilum]|uniref:Chorismate synthase n=1 Tax=Methanoliparum thermophilum TaxID=2491083 RepID=A0A520KTG6_METT2|nr:chorismate synthase [Candidatus Methanoliparum sp. LAM-1]RZN65383.1 MAG: chorismate synthase [Candidatus Methanoliparum thermophilum]BDC35531.1 chorismate synthase [Candidatus Methanoliparum sp. LAM-1]